MPFLKKKIENDFFILVSHQDKKNKKKKTRKKEKVKKRREKEKEKREKKKKEGRGRMLLFVAYQRSQTTGRAKRGPRWKCLFFKNLVSHGPKPQGRP